ncbi:methylcrotonoyl-CoA carboxylase subunit alpha, mitochondrial [Neodiprion lecontei]|uniref:Methylcrotonoyl-CoA carboxylase subunit alpha, mitochondrial n=1 Tax=Neodiprion lecontei TaxID=441921 RepID=A0A6J0BK70_NEOLC|nr:methylcrotonoyl-CoA carboxylase subunit alpha, mitochondrial [Neodiprion lecontei]XP_046598253.1 methylcrotonoyl-CoA carboxylase subunit alpha, mitochondrial [Neodiprion lecontei]
MYTLLLRSVWPVHKTPWHITSWIDREFSLSTVHNGKRLGKILIANRGEIACRIARTARKLGVKTVAVYSDADQEAMHVRLADEAYNIGPAASTESYLKQDSIIEAAKKSKSQAIHPGYGFLSENTEFAELCQSEGITFIGPPASAIRDMGIKNTSKAIMAAAGVPVVPGYHGEDQSNDRLMAEARLVGFPLMIKAVRGGGGKGMRIAFEEGDFFTALEAARTESAKSFGDSAVLLEKYVSEPRHVEVQVFADQHGNAVHLFERDCSVQRRHQKIIEEAPAPGISPELRSELGAAAVRAAKAVKYVGAGTVEFILDRYTHSFHFMEMNTRLQVEHPVTEAITGTDLVEWQLTVAAGEKLPLTQEEIKLAGHAFEARIYAEDPNNGFLPGAGPLLHLTTPEMSADVRVETGVRQGDQVSVHYDPMIAKLVVWGKDRSEAIGKLGAKLAEYNIVGVETNVQFIMDLASHPKFASGDVHTGFIEENHATLFPKIEITNEILTQGALAMILEESLPSLNDASFTPFATNVGLRLNHALERKFQFLFKDKEFVVNARYLRPGVFNMRTNDTGPWRNVSGSLIRRNNVLELLSEIDGVITRARIVNNNGELYLFTNERKWQLTIPPPKFVTAVSSISGQQRAVGSAMSPMPGVVDKIFVQRGDIVKKGDPLLVIVAMKMEHAIKAACDGLVEEVLCTAGENVAKNKLLVRMKEEESV